MFAAIINVKTMTMTYCNCGHEPAILIRKNKFSDLDKGGLVLGIEENFNYEYDTVKLDEDDCILFYTDGLIDAANFDGQFWTRENLLKAVTQFTNGAARHIVKNILTYRRRFVGLAKQVDDTSLIAIKING
jgi:sigma-B regulation protein RsbU (phosphoserine phosphatase)